MIWNILLWLGAAIWTLLYWLGPDTRADHAHIMATLFLIGAVLHDTIRALPTTGDDGK